MIGFRMTFTMIRQLSACAYLCVSLNNLGFFVIFSGTKFVKKNSKIKMKSKELIFNFSKCT